MAQADLDRLLDFVLRFAQEQLKKRGGFHPFGATVDPEGNLKPTALMTEEEQPSSPQLVEQYFALFADLAGEGRVSATAVCYDSLVRDSLEGAKRDAIAVALEHVNGEAVQIYLPYKKKFLRGFQYEPLIAAKLEPRTFSPNSSPDGT